MFMLLTNYLPLALSSGGSSGNMSLSGILAPVILNPHLCLPCPPIGCWHLIY